MEFNIGPPSDPVFHCVVIHLSPPGPSAVVTPHFATVDVASFEVDTRHEPVLCSPSGEHRRVKANFLSEIGRKAARRFDIYSSEIRQACSHNVDAEFGKAR